MRFICAFLFATIVLLPQKTKAEKQWTPELSLSVNRLSDLSFSPDNTRLLYGINSIDLKNDVYLNTYVISDLTSSKVRTLIKPSSHASAVQWSPDGKWVAYLSSQSGHDNIWLIPAEGGEGTQLTNVKQDISSFRWAPNSKTMAFVMADPDYKAPVVENPAVFNKNHIWLIALKNGKVSGDAVNLTKDQDFSVQSRHDRISFRYSLGG